MDPNKRAPRSGEKGAGERAKVVDLSARIFETGSLKTLTAPANETERLKNYLNNLRRMKSIPSFNEKLFTEKTGQESVSKSSIARLQWQIIEVEEALARVSKDQAS